MQNKIVFLSLSFLLVSLLPFLALAPIVQATGLIFASAVNYGAGNAPNYVAAADFTGDGKPDLAVVHALMSDGRPYGGPSVLLNNGDGTFGTATDHTVGYLPQGVALGDFNEDSHVDMAVANFGGTVTIWLNNGSGAFARHSNFWAATSPASIAMADFDKDGHLDLVIADWGGNRACVLLGVGNGDFGGGGCHTANTGPVSATVADFNGDGNADIATAAKDSNKLSVILSTGANTFTSTVSYDVGTQPYSVTSGDFNGDGDPDLVVANSQSSNVSVLLNNGDETFAAPVNYSTSSSARFVTVGDLDDDGKLDLAVAVANGSVGVLLGNGNGTFAPVLFYGAHNSPASVAIANFNGDGHLDLAVANNGTDDVSVLLNMPVPAITSISPTFAAVNAPDFTLTVTGTNFISTSKVQWNGSDRATTYVSNTKLTATILKTDLSVAGTANVTVYSPAPGGGTSDAATFTINPTASTVTVVLNPSCNPCMQNYVMITATVTNTVGVSAPSRAPRGPRDAVPNGIVTFKDGVNDIAGCVNRALNGAGQAICATTLAGGTHTITALYSGNANFNSASGTLTQRMNYLIILQWIMRNAPFP